jgi:hypothetical protein
MFGTAAVALLQVMIIHTTGQHLDTAAEPQDIRGFNPVGLLWHIQYISLGLSCCCVAHKLSATCIAGRNLHWVDEAGDHRAPP